MYDLLILEYGQTMCYRTSRSSFEEFFRFLKIFREQESYLLGHHHVLPNSPLKKLKILPYFLLRQKTLGSEYKKYTGCPKKKLGFVFRANFISFYINTKYFDLKERFKV